MNSILDDLIVVKRSGQRVSFNELKIAIAIKNSFDSISNNYSDNKINAVYEDTISYIENNYKERKTINVEDIQDIIEYILKSKKLFDVYESFSKYRIQRSESRNSFSQKQQHKFVKVIEKAEKNKDNNEKPNVMLSKFGKIISHEYTKAYLLDNKYERAMSEGKIYIHNLPFYNLGYLSYTNLDVTKTLDDNSFYDLINLVLNSKNEINEEVLLGGIDTTLNHYVISNFKKIFIDTIIRYLNIGGYDNLINIKKVEERILKEKTIDIQLYNYKDIFENELLYRIFTLSYNDSLSLIKNMLSTNIRALLKTLNESNNINNKYSLSIGNITSPESILIDNILLEEISLLERLDNVSLIYKLDNKKINKDIIYKLSSLIINNKNILLNYTSCNNIEYFSKGYLIYDNSSIDYISKGRLNVCNISVNMARIALKYQKLNKDFYKELDDTLELTKNSLKDIFEYIGDRNKESYQILFSNNIYDDEKLEDNQKIRKVLKGGSLNINLIGLKECMLLIDKDKISENILKVLKYIYDKIQIIKEEYHLNYTLSVVNEKSSSLDFINMDKMIFGLIKDITDKNLYSNVYKIKDIDTLKEIKKNIHYLNGGSKIELVVNKTSKIEMISNIISSLDNDIGLVSILIGDKK